MKRSCLAILLTSVVVILWLGCNKNKEDVDRLEKEVMEAEGNDIVGDSMAGEETGSEAAATAPASGVKPQSQSEYITTPISIPQPGGFTVQVGSGQSRENVEFLANVYKTRGYEPYITEVSTVSGTVYRVRLGSFASRDEARQLANELKDKFSVDCWIDINHQ